MDHVFLSHSPGDARYVEALEALLTAREVNVWVARRDLPVSDTWLEQMRSAVSGAIVLVVCASPDWYDSEACAMELQAAREHGVPTVFVDAREPADAAAGSVERACQEQGADGRVRAELTRRATDWVRADRPSELLASAGLRRRARRTLRRTALERGPAVEEYLRASARRDRRRWIVAALAVLALVPCVFVINGFQGPGRERGRQLDEPALAFAEANETLTLLRRDPYAAMRAAVALAERPSGDGFADRVQDRLMRVLAAPVPESSHVTPERPVGFTGTAEDRARGLVARASARDATVAIRRAGGARIERRIATSRVPSTVAFSPDGRMLAIGAGSEVDVADVSSGLVRSTLRGSAGAVRALRWSDDGARVSALSAVPRGWRESTWRWRPGDVVVDRPGTSFVALSAPTAAGAVVAVARDGTLQRIDVARRSAATPVRTRVSAVAFAALDPRARTAVLGTPRELVRVDVRDGRVLRRAPQRCPARAAAFSGDGRRVWVACARGPLLEVRPGHLHVVRRVEPGPGGALTVAASAGTVFAAGGSGRVVRIGADGRVRTLLDARCGLPARALALSRGAETIVVAGDGTGALTCPDMGTRARDGRWLFRTRAVPGEAATQALAAALSPDARVAALGYADGTVATFAARDQAPAWRRTDLPGSVRALAFSGDGRELVAATDEGVVEVLPACPACGDTRALTQMVRARLQRARGLGLTAP